MNRSNRSRTSTAGLCPRDRRGLSAQGLRRRPAVDQVEQQQGPAGRGRQPTDRRRPGLGRASDRPRRRASSAVAVLGGDGRVPLRAVLAVRRHPGDPVVEHADGARVDLVRADAGHPAAAELGDAVIQHRARRIAGRDDPRPGDLERPLDRPDVHRPGLLASGTRTPARCSRCPPALNWWQCEQFVWRYDRARWPRSADSS